MQARANVHCLNFSQADAASPNLFFLSALNASGDREPTLRAVEFASVFHGSYQMIQKIVLIIIS